MLQRGSSATGGNMTTSRLFFVMFSTGCQSHSASSTSSVYSSFNHYTELLLSICEIHSFIHSGHFYSAPSSPLPLPTTAWILYRSVSEFHAEAHRQLQVKDLPKVP